MIDYIALSLGHGLLAIALWRLFMRDAVDADPLIESIRAEEQANRKAIREAGRTAMIEETPQAWAAPKGNARR